MPMSRLSVRRCLWAAPAIVVAAAAAAWVAYDRSGRQPGADGSPAGPAPAPAEATEKDVHTFCGQACHSYPPADTFPRRYWRTEVERGYRFLEQSGQSVPTPPIESVVRA